MYSSRCHIMGWQTLLSVLCITSHRFWINNNVFSSGDVVTIAQNWHVITLISSIPTSLTSDYMYVQKTTFTNCSKMTALVRKLISSSSSNSTDETAECNRLKHCNDASSGKPTDVLVCRKDVVFVVAIVVAADFHNTVKHFRKPNKTIVHQPSVVCLHSLSPTY